MSDEWKRVAVVGGLAVCATGLTAYGLYKLNKSNHRHWDWKEVGKVTHLLIHPVKACRGLHIERAECTPLGMKISDGLVYDRRYIILNGDNNVVTMRQRSALALIQTSISDDGKYLQLDAPDMTQVKLPLGVKVENDDDVIRFRLWRLQAEGYNCGEEVSQWLDKYLEETGHKLVCYTPDLEPKRNFEDPKWGSRASTHDQSAFQDLAHFHLFTHASLDEVNNKLENETVGIRNFRPNFVVKGVHEAFEEDNWKYVRIGDNVILRKTHLCGRCKQTTVNPETGVVSEEPLKTLKGFRCVDSSHPDHKGLGGSPAFGLNLNLEVNGTVAVGDTVYASY